jgi:hypothetical protein
MKNDNKGTRVWLVVLTGLFVGCGGIETDDVIGSTAQVQSPRAGGDRVGVPDQDNIGSLVEARPADPVRQQPHRVAGADAVEPAGAPDRLPGVEFKRRQVLEIREGGRMLIPVSYEINAQQDLALTLELWFRLDGTHDQTLVQAGSLALELKNERLEARLDADSSVSSYNIVADEWYHAAVTVSRGYLTLWVNGSPMGRAGLNSCLCSSLSDVVVGGFSRSGDAFSGRVDNLRLIPELRYSESFTPDQQLEVLDSMIFGFSFDDTMTTDGQVEDQGYTTSIGHLEGDARLVAAARPAPATARSRHRLSTGRYSSVEGLDVWPGNRNYINRLKG